MQVNESPELATAPSQKIFERFDLVALALVIVLAAAILLTIINGDHAGVAVLSMTPQNAAHSTMPVRITFAEPMDTASVESHFRIEPTVKGAFSWVNGTQLTFKPSEGAFEGGQAYAITILAGAESVQGRKLSADSHWTFTPAVTRIVYIAPAVEDTAPANLWTVDPAAPFVTKQLTFTDGILPDYAISPDGTRIAYSQKEEHGAADIYILNLDTNEIQRVTHCIDAMCQAPNWSPDQTRLVYERVELNSALAELDRGVPRPWLVTLADLSTAPLLPSSQLLGKQPRWSPDGTQITVYDQNIRGIVVYDLTSGASKAIQSLDGDSGLFDPSGAMLVYPDVEQTQNGFINTLSVANLRDPQKGVIPLRDESSFAEDRQAAWNPDGKRLAVARRYLDDRQTQGAQVYLVNLATKQAEPLIVDTLYNHGAISWSPSGDALLMQRFPFNDENPQPGIWVYDMATKSLHHVAKNGYLPQWLP